MRRAVALIAQTADQVRRIPVGVDAGRAPAERAVRRGVREQGGPAADDLRAQGAGRGREGRGGSGAAVQGLGSSRFVFLADGYKCTPGASRSQGDGTVGECVLRLILSWAGVGGDCTDKLRSLRGHDNPRGAAGRTVGQSSRETSE